MAGNLTVNNLACATVNDKSMATHVLENGLGGSGQTWQNMTASRTAGATYTNTTGRPIMVAIAYYTNVIGNDCAITVDGTPIKGNGIGSSIYIYLTCFAIVPNGSTYSVNAKSTWAELR